jgi:transcriptional antiterminator RfaH
MPAGFGPMKHTSSNSQPGTAILADVPRWYVIQTRPKEEDRADSNLRAWKIETFTPKFKERRSSPYSSSQNYVLKHLFPRYIFARFCATRLFHVNYTRGVQKVVGFGEGPAPLDDEIVELIKSRLNEEGVVRIGEPLKPGDQIVVKAGPLKGLAGIFERTTNDIDRVMILLSAVGYQARITVEREFVRKAAHSVNT